MAMRGERKKELEQESLELHSLMSDSKTNYTVEDRLHAVMLFITNGNMRKVSEISGVPYHTLAGWKESNWWSPAITFCHKKKDKELDTKLSQVIHDTVSEIMDRVKNGDVVISKTGNKIRKPINGRDLATIVGIVYEKRALIRGEATSNTITQGTHKDKLRALEDKFNQFSAQLRAKTIEGEVIVE